MIGHFDQTDLPKYEMEVSVLVKEDSNPSSRLRRLSVLPLLRKINATANVNGLISKDLICKFDSDYIATGCDVVYIMTLRHSCVDETVSKQTVILLIP